MRREVKVKLVIFLPPSVERVLDGIDPWRQSARQVYRPPHLSCNVPKWQNRWTDTGWALTSHLSRNRAWSLREPDPPGAIERVRQAWPEGVETIHEIHARFDAIGPQYVLGISLRDSFGRKDTMRRNFEFQPRRTSVAAILGVTACRACSPSV
jgi:hypothetical protein